MANLRIVALTYKTFPAELPVVQDVAVDVLRRMGMRVTPLASPQDPGGAGILASAWRRQLHVELETTGIGGTRARVLAKDGILFEENAASDFIGRVMRRLERAPHDAPTLQVTPERLPAAIAG